MSTFFVSLTILLYLQGVQMTAVWDFEKTSYKITDTRIYTSVVSFIDANNNTEELKTFVNKTGNYLLINNKEISIGFKELDSFAIISDIYYICPRDNFTAHVYSYNPLNDTSLNEIINPNITSSNVNFSKWRVKCIYTPIDESGAISTMLFVPFLGTSYLYVYKTTTKEWMVGLTISKYYADMVINPEVHTDDNKYYIVYSVIYSNGYLFSVYKVKTKNDGLLASISTIKTKEISRDEGPSTSFYVDYSAATVYMYLITYGASLSTISNVYYNADSSTDIMENNSFTSFFPLSLFEGYTITSINQINNSKYFYYTVETNNAKTIYWGIGDIKEKVIIYNSRQPLVSIRPYQDQTALLVETMKGFYMICFLILTDGKCGTCPSSYPLILNLFGPNFCDYTDSTGGYRLCDPEHYYYDEVSKGCIECDSTNFIVKPENFCLKDCNTEHYLVGFDSVLNNQTCISCSAQGKYYKKGESSCLDTVPDGFFVVDEDNKILQKCDEKCVTCENSATNCLKCNSSYFAVEDTNECVLDCNYPYVKNDKLKLCVNCKTNNEVRYENSSECISAPSDGFYYINETFGVIASCSEDCTKCNSNQCLECKSGKFLLDGYCSSSCGVYLYEDTTRKKCINCFDEGKVKYLGNTNPCISLPSNVYFYIDKQLGVIGNCHSRCQSCSAEGTDTNNHCDSCSTIYQINPSSTGNCIPKCTNQYEGVYNDQCINCKTENLVKYQNSPLCVDKPTDETTFTYINEDYAVISNHTVTNSTTNTNTNTTNPELNDILDNLDRNIVDFLENNNNIITNEFTLEVYDTSVTHTTTSNTSSITLGQCESILRNYYSIFRPNELIISKIDIITDSYQLVNNVQYAVYAPNGTKLDLSLCDSVGISVEVPIKDSAAVNFTLMSTLTKDGIDIFNKSDPFFNDICVPYDSDDSAGLPFSMRKNLYVNSSLCNDSCSLKSIEASTKKANCKCTTKNSSSSLGAGMKNEFKDTIFNNNIFVIKCYQQVFSLKKLKNNVGSYIFIVFFILQVLNLLYFCITFIKPIQAMVLDIIEKRTSSPPNRIKSNSNLVLSENVPHIEESTKTLTNSSPSLNNLIPNKKNCCQTLALNNIQTTNSIQLYTTNDIEVKKYTNEELNGLAYDEAIENDKRSFGVLYLEFLKHKQPVLNAFILKTEISLNSIKIAMLYLSIAMSFCFNAIFYTEDLQTKNYESNGKLSFLSTLPKVLISCVGSVIISTILTLISSYHSKLEKLKKDKSISNIGHTMLSFLTITKCKLIIYFIVIFILMIFFWYFVTAFCAVYPKYQTLWLIDSLKSLCLSMVFPFFFAMVIVLFRYIGLKKKKSCCYCFSKVINIV